MPDILRDYREALGRLRAGRTINVPKGTKITNDSVSLEAGRKKGTIKRSRPVFKPLIDAIDAAAAEQSRPADAHKQEVEELKAEVKRYRTLWEEALAREVSLVKQLWDERQEWANEKAALTGEKVVLMNGRSRGRS
ncbi:MAG: hypothetical protein U1F58_09730 [Burkholderiales bacterium]